MLMSTIRRLREKWRVRHERRARLAASRNLPWPDPGIKRAGEGGSKTYRMRESGGGGG
jgi:hypothetical protein